MLSNARSEIRMNWNPVSGATAYVVDLGRSFGSSNLGSFNVDVPSFTKDALPPGRVFARVRAQNTSGTSAATADVSDWYFDFRDYIEAQFLGTGPLTPTDGNHGCSATGWVRGFPVGTDMPVIVSTTVSTDKATAIRNAVDQVSQATAGRTRAHYTETTDPNPLPAQNQVTSTTNTSPSSQGCPSDSGCTIHQFVNNASPGKYYSSRAVQPPGQTPEAYAHDVVGHGALGLCHVDGNLIGGAQLSLMSAGPGIFSGDIARGLTTYDLEAARALYAAGVEPGDQRQDLLGAGLIRP